MDDALSEAVNPLGPAEQSASLGASRGPEPPPRRRRFDLEPLTSRLTVAPRDWLIEDLWPQQAVGFIGGPPKAGKSWLALELAISVTAGVPFLGKRPLRLGPVIYFLGEEHKADVHNRVGRLLEGHGRTYDDLGERFLYSDTIPCLELDTDRIGLGRAATEESPLLIVMDPLERFLGQGDANTTRDMRPVTNFLRRALSREGNTAVCVVHHTDKKRGVLRGTGDFRAVSEVTMLLGEATNGRVRVETEMRNSRPPDPYYLALRDGHNGSIGWALEDTRIPRISRDQEAREFLQRAGEASSEDVQRALVIRAASVKPLMERIGAVRETKRSPWRFPQVTSARVGRGGGNHGQFLPN